MIRYSWQILLGLSLLIMSILLYFAQIEIFHDPRDTFFYLLQDLAFIPVQVLLVTVILNRILNVREKRATLSRLNMIIGIFFSEVGTNLLKAFTEFDHHITKNKGALLVESRWTEAQFSAAMKRLQNYDYNIDCSKSDLRGLKVILAGKRDFLLKLLENPNLLEHEAFTELLLAIFHLTEELTMRKDLVTLTPADGAHIAVDIQRAYAILIMEWLVYMKHLKNEYPYLFSLAIRTNPFDEKASIIIK
ncbi:MAG TPA: hypothetical protein VLX29_09095 [Nitrospirota bacterium]|nr:hypothetical protein [Nitrospirota bacterium]